MGIIQQGDRFERGTDSADLIGERREAQGNALRLQPVALAVERLMQSIFLEDEIGQKVRAEHAPGRDMEGSRGLADLFTVPAGDFLAHRLDNLVARGHLLQGFGDVGRQMAQFIRTAAGALFGCGDNALLALQMGREVAAGSPLAGEGTNGGCFGRGLRGEALGFTGIGFKFFEAQFELADKPACPLRFRSIFVAAHERVHQFKMRVASKKIGVDRLDLNGSCLCLERLGLSGLSFSLGCPGQFTRHKELGMHPQKLRGSVVRGHGCP